MGLELTWEDELIYLETKQSLNLTRMKSLR